MAYYKFIIVSLASHSTRHFMAPDVDLDLHVDLKHKNTLYNTTIMCKYSGLASLQAIVV